MPLSNTIPISISALNDNVDADLSLALRNLTVNQIFDGSGRWRIALPNAYGVAVINAAGTVMIQVFRILGNTDTPRLELFWPIDMNANQINELADPTLAQDAATRNYVDTNDDTHSTADRAYTDAKFPAWADWTPTLTWGGATPASLTTVARWTQIGKTVYFSFYTTSTDSNGCTGLSFTLPVTTIMAASVFAGYEIYGVAGVTYGSLIPYGTATPTRCSFRDFKAATDGQRIAVIVEGFYEVA